MKIIAAENLEQQGTDALVADETVRVVTEAFVVGEVKLPLVVDKTSGRQLRVVRSVVPCGEDALQSTGSVCFTALGLGAGSRLAGP